MKKLQEQRVLVAAKRETDAYAQDMLNRGITNIHILATTAADPNLEQTLAPQPQPQNWPTHGSRKPNRNAWLQHGGDT